MMETKPSLPTAQPLLEARRLTVAYRRRGRWLRAVRGVDLSVPKGRTLGLVGESGCGKTSLGRALLRLVPVAGGTIDFDGTDVRSLSSGGQGLRRFRKRAQMVFQDAAASLNPRMCVGAIVADPLAAHRWGDRSARRRRVADLLEMVGLDSSLVNRYPHELSGGQRQRVNIARALALEPEFIVCDEPISALDVAAQCEILDLLDTLRDALGLSMLFITHNLGVAERFCDDVAVMYLGSIIEIAPAKSLLFEARHPYTATLRDAILPLKLDARFHQESATSEALSPLDLTPGCAYQSRCPHASQRCRDEAPSLLMAAPSSSSHLFACHHPLMPSGHAFGA